MDDDQKYGLEGIEHDQGFERMPVASPVDVPEPDHMTEHELSHLKRPAPSEPEVREYRDVNTGEEIPANQTVTAEQASSDIQRVRDVERQAREDLAAQDLRSALDQTEQPQQTAQDQQPAALDEIQPEAAESPAGRETWDPVDQKIGQFLESDPAIAERIQSSYAQVVQQSQAHVDQVRQVYAAATNQLAQEINIVTAALIPEIVGMSPEAARGALAVVAKQDPARMQQIINFANRVQGAVNLTQQQAHAQEQANQQQFATYQQKAAEDFKQFAQAEDAKALANETPESISAIRKTILADAKAAGVSEKDLYEAYNTVPALRHSFVQGLMADGAKWRASQRALRAHAVRPVPAVQRPGTASARPTDPADLSVAQSRFNLNPSRELGAALIAARRRG